MKLVMTLLVRDEAELIESNLDYHLAQGVDFVVVTDHGSTDETGEILHRYEQAGVVTVIREEDRGYHQSVRVTRMAKLALSDHGADWIIHNDADEFWWPLSGSLRDVFAAIPAGYGQIEVQRRNFLPRPDAPGPFHSRLLYRDTRSLNPRGVPLEAKIAHRAHPDVVLAPGNHSISGAELKMVPTSEVLEIFHFPMRSYEQFEQKVLQTGIGYKERDDLAPHEGQDQLKLLAIHREGGLRKYYEDALLDDDALAQALKQRSVVLDRRLDDFVQRMSRPVVQTDRPDGPSTRSLISRTLDVFPELDRTRTQIAELEQRDAVHQAELATAGEAIQSLMDSQLEARRQTANVEKQVQSMLDREGASQAQMANLERQLQSMLDRELESQTLTANLEEQLETCRAELASAGDELRTLRNSRVVRWSTPMRRLWYRVRAGSSGRQ